MPSSANTGTTRRPARAAPYSIQVPAGPSQSASGIRRTPTTTPTITAIRTRQIALTSFHSATTPAATSNSTNTCNTSDSLLTTSAF